MSRSAFFSFSVPKVNPEMKEFRRILCKDICKLARRGCHRAEHSSWECSPALGKQKQSLSKSCAHVLGTFLPTCHWLCSACPRGHSRAIEVSSTRASRDHHCPKPNQQLQLCLHPRLLAVGMKLLGGKI